jgi:hypothetical protein
MTEIISGAIIPNNITSTSIMYAELLWFYF